MTDRFDPEKDVDLDPSEWRVLGISSPAKVSAAAAAFYIFPVWWVCLFLTCYSVLRPR